MCYANRCIGYFSLLYVYGGAEVWSGANERRLINDLGLYNVSVYNKLERPVVNESQTLNVSFSLVLQQIIGVVSTVTYPLRPTSSLSRQLRQL